MQVLEDKENVPPCSSSTDTLSAVAHKPLVYKVERPLKRKPLQELSVKIIDDVLIIHTKQKKQDLKKISKCFNTSSIGSRTTEVRHNIGSGSSSRFSATQALLMGTSMAKRTKHKSSAATSSRSLCNLR
ncbi:hypothetical protein SJAG_01515 [Schizosaccharomyces japonicus yFS275]|uniref:Uncharacterized protein n=1 Tax=Schizosaccharomyces japonicus (strain yFS275 / FY16936) TaxID=402676 RepID=B6JY56_SCHJY|nr:hypothetical protein SJAG_01515 [Schizosaccharomyces japonicus yFS275]EEB06474.1 hypothetical protein SJAG_01515 [Schizosaccharomyces japonicus yFS275]